MNTFQIYEEFKVSLGDAAAKSLAQTLGTMFDELRNTVTQEDFRILRESIDTNVSRLDAAITKLAIGQEKLVESQARTDASMAKLAEAQAGTDARISELAVGQEKLLQAQARTDASIVKLTEAQALTDASIVKLTESQALTDASIVKLTESQALTDASIAKLTESQARTDASIVKLTEAQAITDASIVKLTEAQARTDASIATLIEGQARTDGRMAELTAAQARTDASMATLAEAQGRTEQQMRTMADAIQRLAIRTDAVIGDTFELRFRDRLTAYLGRFLRRGKVVPNDVLLDALEPCVTTEEVEDFLRADIVAKGLVNGAETYVVVEVSSTGDTEDIVRAERRAAILRKAGLAAIPLVACTGIPAESLDFAHRSGVHVWCNGLVVDAA